MAKADPFDTSSLAFPRWVIDRVIPAVVDRRDGGDTLLPYLRALPRSPSDRRSLLAYEYTAAVTGAAELAGSIWTDVDCDEFLAISALRARSALVVSTALGHLAAYGAGRGESAFAFARSVARYDVYTFVRCLIVLCPFVASLEGVENDLHPGLVLDEAR